MKLRQISLLVVCAALAVGGMVRADAFDPKHVPATAKWVVHVDVDALKDTQTGRTLKRKFQNTPQFVTGMAQIRAITKIGAVEDFHDVTVYGSGSEDEGSVVMIHAPVDHEHILTMLQNAPNFANIAYHDHTIYTWGNGAGTQYGAFAGKDVAIIGHSQEAIQAQLDTLDGTGKSIDPKSTMAGGVKPGVLVYICGRDLTSLKTTGEGPQRLIAFIDDAWVSLNEDPTNATLNAQVIAKTPQAAKQLAAILEGVKAFVTLTAGSDNADATTKLAAKALENLKTDVKEKSVSINLPVNLELIRQVIDVIRKDHQPEPQP